MLRSIHRNNQKLLLRCFFVLNCFIYLLKFESSLYTHPYCSSAPLSAPIALVIPDLPDYTATIFSFLPSTTDTPDFGSALRDCGPEQAYALVCYNNHVQTVLDAFKGGFNPLRNRPAFLLRGSVLQSSDDDPLLLG
jgi:hypothetical protein